MEGKVAELGWRDWLVDHFKAHTSKGFSFYHEEFWEWAWSIEKNKRPRPFVAIWPRGGAKSTSSELACVALGARKRRKYALYICMTQEQSDDHVGNIAAMLESDAVMRDYQDLGKPLLGKFGNSKGWRRNRCRTASGFTIDALGLDSAARGVKLDEQRPDLIIFDDIDAETDSKELTEKKVKILTRKLIPAGSPDVALLFVQNLVHKDSVIARMADGRADFAADRIVSGAYPALRNFDFEREGSRTVITAGEATWPQGMPKERCQEMIDDMGLAAFLAECQHKVDQISGEKSFREYDEVYHVITWLEFAAVYGQAKIPARWHKARGLDWGTTPKHPTAVIFSTRPTVRDPLDDCVFTFAEVVRPRWPPADAHAEIEMVSPGRVAQAIDDKQRSLGIEDSHIKKSLMSHEASAALATFLIDLPKEIQQYFNKWKAKKGSGVPQIQELLTIDRKRPHPFRRDPKTNKPLMGRPRHFIIVDDSQGALYYDIEGKLKVRQPTDEKGLARLRSEIPEFDERATGKDKIFDDAVDAWRGMAAAFFVAGDALSEAEQIERSLPERVRKENIQNLPPQEQQRAIDANDFWTRELKQQEEDEDRFYFEGRLS